MKVTVWGARGSLPTPGPETARYGGNTPCLSVLADDGSLLIFDAGTGILRLAQKLPKGLKRLDIFLTHLHMDHIQGLGFFSALYMPKLEVHLWGPASTTMDLRSRLTRYLSPPLFPVRLRDLPCNLHLHHVPCCNVQIADLSVDSELISHPGPTVGYRISSKRACIAYMPDHEPALGRNALSLPSQWLSGFTCARNVDFLFHDAQYTEAEYTARIGWGHSSVDDALRYCSRVGAKQLVTFHHDPTHSDSALEKMLEASRSAHSPEFGLSIAAEGQEFTL